MVPPDLLPGGGDPAANPEPERRRARAAHPECEFCGCVLTDDGTIITVGEKATKYRKLSEENQRLEGIIATLRQEIEDLKRPRTPEPAPQPARRIF